MTEGKYNKLRLEGKRKKINRRGKVQGYYRFMISVCVLFIGIFQMNILSQSAPLALLLFSSR
jgi:hypothetical protein